jgi:diguanylate cyclase (GGDEF)-like protein/hemerythrin-like metal-binding protein/PAS domain S-box-containing protein
MMLLQNKQEFNPQALFATLVESRAIAVAVFQDDIVTFANPAFSTLFGCQDSLTGHVLHDLIAECDRRKFVEVLGDVKQAPVIHTCRALRTNGCTFDIELHLAGEVIDGQPVVVALAENVSLRRMSEQQLRSLAYSDALTGLPNRALLADRLRDAVLDAQRGGFAFAFLMADLDGLKAVNDTYGHQAGDTVIQLLARRFRNGLRETDTLARMGGDEFGILLPQLKTPEHAENVAARLVQDAGRPLEVGGREVCVGASVGIAVYPDHAVSVDALLAAADAALYRVKQSGRSHYEWASATAPAKTFSLPLIVWTAAHKVGVKEIDEQHMRLASLINELVADLRNGVHIEGIAGKLAGLIRFAELHFAAEERLMAEHRFRNAARHIAMHKQLLDDVRNFALGCDFRRLSLFTRFLEEWLLRHIHEEGKNLGRALNARGVR